MKTCWYYRTLTAWKRTAGTPLPRHLTDHLANCRECANLTQAGSLLDARLRREARAIQRPAPPYLAARVQARLRQRASADTEHNLRGGAVWAAALAGVVVLAILGHWAWQPSPSSPPSPLAVAQVYPLDRLALSNAPAWLGRTDDWQQPLRAEMDGLVKDTSSALQHLAQAFLPGKTASE